MFLGAHWGAGLEHAMLSPASGPRGAGLPSHLAALLDSRLLLHRCPVHQALQRPPTHRGAHPALHLLPGHWAHAQHPGRPQRECRGAPPHTNQPPPSRHCSAPPPCPWVGVPNSLWTCSGDPSVPPPSPWTTWKLVPDIAIQPGVTLEPRFRGRCAHGVGCTAHTHCSHGGQQRFTDSTESYVMAVS